MAIGLGLAIVQTTEPGLVHWALLLGMAVLVASLGFHAERWWGARQLKRSRQNER